jgi:hypothetical protein
MNNVTLMRIRKVGPSNEIQVLIRTVPPADSGTTQEMVRVETLRLWRNADPVVEIHAGASIAANPLFRMTVDQLRPGDTVRVDWHGSRGATGRAVQRIG